ncbi:PLDc N-terminal domain-containing protein [Rathayibacter agropyri]
MVANTSYFHIIFLGLSVIVVAWSIWALAITVRKKRVSLYYKVVWGVVLLLFPGIGLIIWLGVRWWTRSKRTASGPRAKIGRFR